MDFHASFHFLQDQKYRTEVIRQNRLLIISKKSRCFANENALPANLAENQAKKPANHKRRMF